MKIECLKYAQICSNSTHSIRIHNTQLKCTYTVWMLPLLVLSPSSRTLSTCGCCWCCCCCCASKQSS